MWELFMIDVIIPTQLESGEIRRLVRQIEATACYPHRIVYTGSQGSASANRNLGLSQVQSDVAVMVDDDIEFAPNCHGWLRILAETIQRPEVVMVSAQLLSPDGKFAYMTGIQDCGLEPRIDGETVVPSKRLLTACCGFKHHGLRFDERFIGSGFEDLDYCNQLAKTQPNGVFLVCHGALAVHRNEAKNQRGKYWKHNEKYYLRKWGIK